MKQAQKKSVITTILLVIITVNAFSQGWGRSKPISNTYYNYNDINFADNQKGIAVGWNGVIIRTTDGGNNWTEIPNLLDGNLIRVSFPDVSNAWVISETTVINSTDGGSNWDTQYTGTFNYLDIEFINSTTGFLVGYSDTILKTTDGGTTWEKTSMNNPNSYLSDINFINNTTGYISAYSGQIYKTLDGGATWDTLNTGTSGISSVFFIDSNTGWAVDSAEHILKTTDGGNNWTNYEIGIMGQYDYNKVLFVSASKGWAIAAGYTGGKPTIVNTTDGGETWIEQLPSNNYSTWIYSIYFFNENIGIIPASGGYFYQTTDGGVGSNITGIQNDISTLENDIYPNPSEGILNIEGQYEQLDIYDVKGTWVVSYQNQKQINISNLEKGIYFFNIDNQNHKVIIQ